MAQQVSRTFEPGVELAHWLVTCPDADEAANIMQHQHKNALKAKPNILRSSKKLLQNFSPTLFVMHSAVYVS